MTTRKSGRLVWRLIGLSVLSLALTACGGGGGGGGRLSLNPGGQNPTPTPGPGQSHPEIATNPPAADAVAPEFGALTAAATVAVTNEGDMFESALASALANPGDVKIKSDAFGGPSDVSIAVDSGKLVLTGAPGTTSSSIPEEITLADVKTTVSGYAVYTGAAVAETIPYANQEDVSKDFGESNGSVFLYGKASTAKSVVMAGKADMDSSKPLEYSNFGYWAENTSGNVVTTKTGEAPKEWNDIESGKAYGFYLGVDANKADAPNSGTFTGKVLASAYKPDDASGAMPGTSIIKHVEGTAALNVTNATTGTLALTMPGFYDLSGNLAFSTGGGITGKFDTVTANSNATGITLSQTMADYDGTGQRNNIDGNFYGGSGTASEAAGKFDLKGVDGAGVTGAFGARN